MGNCPFVSCRRRAQSGKSHTERQTTIGTKAANEEAPVEVWDAGEEGPAEPSDSDVLEERSRAENSAEVSAGVLTGSLATEAPVSSEDVLVAQLEEEEDDGVAEALMRRGLDTAEDEMSEAHNEMFAIFEDEEDDRVAAAILARGEGAFGGQVQEAVSGMDDRNDAMLAQTMASRGDFGGGAFNPEDSFA